MRPLRCLMLVGVLLPCGLAVAGLDLDLTYDFEPGAESATHLAAQIDRVQMGANVPLAVTGGAEADLTLEVLSVDEEGVATVRVSFGEVAATLMGQPQEPQSLDPIELRVDQKGRLASVGGLGEQAMDIFASGGVPLQLVALLGGVVELPESAVEVGESWTVDRSEDIAALGEVSMQVVSRLESLDEDEAVVLTDIQASFPDFTAKNPMQEGDVTIRNGLLTVEGMRRTIAPATGLIASASAEMGFTCMAAVGGFAELPLDVNSSFTLEAAEATEPAEGAEPAVGMGQPGPAAPGGRAQPRLDQVVVEGLQRYLGGIFEVLVKAWEFF